MYRDDPEIAKKYRSKRWQKVRQLKKIQDPICERCKAKGIITPVYIVHHKEYITDKNYMDDDIFFNLDNLESLCLACHNKEHFGERSEIYFDSNGDVKAAPQ